MAYKIVIDPNKWIPVSEFKIEPETPYWCKMTDGRIIMIAHYSNNISSGMAECFIDNNGIMIKADTFYIIRGCKLQPVIFE